MTMVGAVSSKLVAITCELRLTLHILVPDTTSPDCTAILQRLKDSLKTRIKTVIRDLEQKVYKKIKNDTKCLK